eukprot:7391762-Prymnesium_polylepis.3
MVPSQICIARINALTLHVHITRPSTHTSCQVCCDVEGWCVRWTCKLVHTAQASTKGTKSHKSHHALHIPIPPFLEREARDADQQLWCQQKRTLLQPSSRLTASRGVVAQNRTAHRLVLFGVPAEPRSAMIAALSRAGWGLKTVVKCGSADTPAPRSSGSEPPKKTEVSVGALALVRWSGVTVLLRMVKLNVAAMLSPSPAAPLPAPPVPSSCAKLNAFVNVSARSLFWYS